MKIFRFLILVLAACFISGCVDNHLDAERYIYINQTECNDLEVWIPPDGEYGKWYIYSTYIYNVDGDLNQYQLQFKETKD